MTVHVDELRLVAPYRAGSWFWPEYCHMVSDDLKELHLFARSIGLRKEWFQEHPKPWRSHYDLTPNKRAHAVRKGAIETPAKEWIRAHMETP